MKKLFFGWLGLTLLMATVLPAQESLLRSGPMLGYSEMKEVMLWVQTTTAAEVQIAYWPQEDPAARRLTAAVQTTKEEAFTAHLIADEVEPGARYDYQVLVNGTALERPYPTTFQTQELWQWRTDPPTFRFAMGSCNYVNETAFDRPGQPYGSDHQIFSAIYQQQPDMMLWLGDNVYLREVDWYSRTGILHRYTHTRSLPELQPLLASTHHYAVWDDHDYGPDNSDRSFVHKDQTLDAFKLFWGNPTYGLKPGAGITTMFQWADCDFFLLDDRWFRSPNERVTGDRTMLGQQQLEWLIDALVASRANFKFVALGNQLLNDSPRFENYIKHFEEERAYLLRRLEEENLRNVVFLTGDRHRTELSLLVTEGGLEYYDLTVSPFTAGVATPVDGDVNSLRVEGTLLYQHNFAVLEVSGPYGRRLLSIRVFNADGEEQWRYQIGQRK